MTRRNLHREDGWVLVSAIVLMAIMVSVGLSAYAFVDTGQKRSRESRERESSLSLAEAALYAQGFALTRYWPNPNKQLGGDCSSSAALTATTLYCPDRNTLAKGSSGNGTVAQFSTVDYGANATWTTSVRDNYGALKASYSEKLVDVGGGVMKKTSDIPLTENNVACPQTPCRMDFNGDNQLWVQAKAMVRGKPRSIVARLKLEKLRESVPQAGVVAGALQVTNSGNKQMVDGSGSTIVVRCTNLADPNCMKYDAGKSQLTPTPSSTPGQPNFMTPSQLKRFKTRAIADGTYFAGCPTNAAQLTGAVVWVESCTTSYANIGPYSTPCAAPVVPSTMSNNCINPTTKPGMLIWHCGTIRFTAASTYYGIMYVVNNSDGTCASFTAKSGCSTPVYESGGGSGVLGALVVDGAGCVAIGSNSLNMKFDANVFSGVTSYGTVGLVQNTWREIKPGP